jgi:TRAP transporter TAXI family solute receptor
LSIVATALLVAGLAAIGALPAAAQRDDSDSSRTTGRSQTPAPASATNAAERANANTVAVVSGNINGTYLSIAYDLSAVLDDGDSFRILPIIGKGGGQNLRDVLLLKGVDIGITQSSLLSYFQRTNELGRLDQKISYITKLFNEEMHIVVRRDSGLTSLAQLDGKRVNFSDIGSGTQYTTRDIFTRLGLKPIEVNMGQADAFEKLKSGEIAATILIAGKPTGAMSKLTEANGFKLLPVAYSKELQNDYLPTRLTSQDYPGLLPAGSSIETVAASAVLIAYNWPKDTDRYRRIEKFVESFFPRIAEFQKPPRHPKWSETVLAAELKGWTRFPAAAEWVQRSKPTAAVRDQFEEFMASRRATAGEPVTPAARQQLFQDFLQWSGGARR